MHKAAKSVVAGWLRDAAKNKGPDGQASFRNILWEPANDAHLGVYEEYPVVRYREDHQRRVDEIYVGKSSIGYTGQWRHRGYMVPPTYEKCVELGMIPSVIFDILVTGNWETYFAVEIIHKNPISHEKIEKLKKINIPVISFSASWVLAQIGKPVDPKYDIVHLPRHYTDRESETEWLGDGHPPYWLCESIKKTRVY